MDRIIKFKAWCYETKTMVEGKHFYVATADSGSPDIVMIRDIMETGIHILLSMGAKDAKVPGDGYELLQFIRHDNKGNEIYEMDVVQWNAWEVNNGKRTMPIYKKVVTMDPKCLVFLENLCRNNGTVEVLSSSLEHPELLEK